MNEFDTSITTDICRILVRCSRARSFRDPLLDSVLEEQDRTNQQDPFRNPRPHPGLLGQGLPLQGSRPDRTHPRVPGLEGGVHIRSSLWTNLNCKNKDKALTYLERSKSLPVNLSLDAGGHLPSHHPFFGIIPYAIGRLRFLKIKGMLGFLKDIADHLSCPAPLLEELTILRACDLGTHHNPVLTPTLFDGDLSSLRTLSLSCVRTELPWRNMVNLRSFSLRYQLSDAVTVRQLLDFFEGTPHLREVYSTPPP
jgi:hypothetical protein